MSRDEAWIQQRLVRPALVAWTLIASVMLVLLVFEVAMPPGTSPVDHLFRHRENMVSNDLKAAKQAEDDLGPQRLVYVETDRRMFFALLRYRMYPCWVLSERELEAWQSARSDCFTATVVYLDGSLKIGGGGPE